MTSQTTDARPVRSRPALLLGIVWTAALAVAVLPDLVGGLDRFPPFAQVVAFRPWLAAATVVLAVLLGVLTVFRRRAWPVLAGTVAVALAAAVLVLPRAIPGPVPTEGRTLTVLSTNVYLGEADPQALVDLIRETAPDVVSLQETADRFGDRIEPLVAPLGYRLHLSVPPGTPDVRGVGVLVAERLGDVQVRGGDGPYLEVSGGALGGVTVVAYHAAAPTEGRMASWRADLARLARWCSGPGRAVVAGDLNSTLDHSLLRAGTAGCTDAAESRGAGLVPTWSPSVRTRVLGPQIDHVFSTPGVDAETFSVHEISGSDHRAVLTTLRVRPS